MIMDIVFHGYCLCEGKSNSIDPDLCTTHNTNVACKKQVLYS